MLFRRLLVCALLEACSDDGGASKNGQYAVEDLNGYWVEQTGDSYKAIEFRPTVPMFNGAPRYYAFEGTIHTDAKPLRNADFDVDGNTLALYYNADYANGEFHSIDAFDGDTLTLTHSESHTYKRASACPIAPREGAWLWSSLNPMGGPGTSSVTIGPDGPA